MSGASALEALVQQKSFSWTADRQHIKIGPHTFPRKTLTPYKSARSSSTPPSQSRTELPAARNWTGCLVALLGASLHWRASLLLCHMWLLRVVAACGEQEQGAFPARALDHGVAGNFCSRACLSVHQRLQLLPANKVTRLNIDMHFILLFLIWLLFT